VKKAIELLEKAREKTAIAYVEGDIFRRETIENIVLEAHSLIDEAIEKLKKPRWYTPERWEAETGEAWPDNGPVYIMNITYENLHTDWHVASFCMAKVYRLSNVYKKTQIVCATNNRPPPDDWRAEDTK
jgi:hypothetical protein